MVILKGQKMRRGLVGLVAVAVICAAVGTNFVSVKPAAATDYCTTERCKEAEAKEIAASAAAAEAAAHADTLEGEIARLSAENAAISAAIDVNIATAEELSASIEENQKKLDEEQTALAGLLVDMHFESNNSVLMILAGSETISDLAEKESRRENVQTQVTHAARAVKERKEELEKEKEQVDAIIAMQKAQREEIAANEARQTELMNKYRDNASAYGAEAAEASRIKQEEIAAYIRSLGLSETSSFSNDNTGYMAALASRGFSCPRDNWQYNGGYTYAFYSYFVCECTSYVDYRIRQTYGYGTAWSNAYEWPGRSGRQLHSTPIPNSVGWNADGGWGHVVWVEAVYPDGSILYSQYNGTYDAWNGSADARYSIGTAPAWKFQYIYL